MVIPGTTRRRLAPATPWPTGARQASASTAKGFTECGISHVHLPELRRDRLVARRSHGCRPGIPMTAAAGTLRTARAGDEIPVLWLAAQPGGRPVPELLADGQESLPAVGAPLDVIHRGRTSWTWSPTARA